MNGKPPPTEPVKVAPSHLESRQSSDSVTVDDEHLGKAIRFTRMHFRENISVEDMARTTGVSRRTLERLFETHFHCSPRQELILIRVEHARHLLRQTKMPIARVAELSGFSEPRQLNVAFRRTLGIKPSDLRKFGSERHP